MKDIDQEVCCPACGWQHDYESHWQCLCQNHWDAISTGGRCPDCLYEMEKIVCPEEAGGCGTHSHYMSWYGDLDQWLSKELQEWNMPVDSDKEKQRRGSRGL